MIDIFSLNVFDAFSSVFKAILTPDFFNRAFTMMIPLLYGSLGEIFTEKSGNLNLGIPGIIYVGGMSGLTGGYIYECWYCEKNGLIPSAFMCIIIPLISCLVCSALMALIYCFLTVTLRANQNVTGLALTTFGVGLANFFGGSLKSFFGQTGSINVKTASHYYKAYLPFADKLGDFGKMFFSYGFLAYLAIALAVLGWFILNKTQVGLNLRAIGENPATADAAGINVIKYKYLSTCIGGAVAGMGGLFFVMNYSDGGWANDVMGDTGWLAVAIVIFSLWKPLFAILGSFVFGGLCILNAKMSFPPDKPYYAELIKMLPYIVTILVLVIASAKKKREHQPPAHLGQPYFREDR